MKAVPAAAGTATIAVAQSLSSYVQLMAADTTASQGTDCVFANGLVVSRIDTGHDISRTRVPHLKSGSALHQRSTAARNAGQQNRRALLSFGPTSSCYHTGLYIR